MSRPCPIAINCETAPKPVGPYSQAVSAGQFVFLSGQIGLDPATGELVPGGTAEESRRVIANIRAILQAAELDLGHVVRMDIYLTNLNDFAAMNEIYASAFTGYPLPARQTVEVSRLPKGASVEISAIACRETV